MDQEKPKIEVPNDSVNRGLEALAAHPRVPESLGRVALRVADARTAIRRPAYEARVRSGQRVERARARSEQSRERLYQEIEKAFGPFDE